MYSMASRTCDLLQADAQSPQYSHGQDQPLISPECFFPHGPTTVRCRGRRSAISLAVEIESAATNITSYGFSLPNGDRLLAVWNDDAAVRRSVALSPNSASPNTAVTVTPAARTCRSSVRANCHLG